MTASYPTSVKSFTTKTDLVTTIQAVDVNDLQDEVVALETSLRRPLTAARTYYVRTDGNDANSGLADSAAGAFLTVQAAVYAAAALDCRGYAITIQIKDGTFTGGVNLKNVVGTTGAGQLVIQGNSSTPANVVISPTSDDCFNADGLSSIWDIKDMKLQTTNSGSGLVATNGSTLRYSGINFGACATNHMTATWGSKLICTGNYTISGNAAVHLQISGNSTAFEAGKTVTYAANVTYSTADVLVTACGNVFGNGMTFSMGAYSATGLRHSVTTNGVLNVSGGGVDYYPGNSSGTTATGGQLV